MKNKARSLLQQVLLQHLEQELSQVPEEQEIRKQHSFSEPFLQNMEKLVSEQDRVISMEKKEKSRRRLFLQMTAACLAVVVVMFGAGTLLLSGIRMGSSEPMESAKATDSSYSMVGGIYDGGTDTEAAPAEMAEAEYAASEEAVSEEGAADIFDTAAVKNDQKLIYTIRMEVETTEYETLLADIRAKIDTLGGYTESSEISGDADRHNRSASLTIRIPAENRNELTETVKTEASVTYSSESAEDVTLEYVDTQSRIDALRTEQKTLMELLEKAEDIDTVLAIQNQLTQVRYELQSYESRLKVMENQVTYSTFYLNIYEVQRVTVPEESGFFTRLQERFVNSLNVLGEGFQNFLLFVLGNFPLLLTAVAVIAVIALVVRKIVRKKKKTPLDHPSEDGQQ